MAKYEWGTKQACTACGAVFYDMMKSPPSCPSCGTKIKLNNRGSPQPQPQVSPKKAKAPAEMLELEEDEELSMADGPEDKELLEQVEDDVEGEVKEVIETGTDGNTAD